MDSESIRDGEIYGIGWCGGGGGGVATWPVEGDSERGYRGVDDFLGLVESKW